jgi:hypothetical protein
MARLLQAGGEIAHAERRKPEDGSIARWLEKRIDEQNRCH